MNLSLSDIANYVTVASLPLTLFTWLVTREHFAKFWKRWWKVVLILVCLLGGFGLVRLGFLDWLATHISIPLWIILLLGLLLLCASTIAFMLLYAANREPSEDDYVTDNIFDVEWQWRYRAGKIVDDDFSSFCPDKQCASRLEIQRRSGYAAVESINLKCPHCGFLKEFDLSWRELRRKTAFEVERRLRTGEFKSQLSKKA